MGNLGYLVKSEIGFVLYYEYGLTLLLGISCFCPAHYPWTLSAVAVLLALSLLPHLPICLPDTAAAALQCGEQPPPLPGTREIAPGLAPTWIWDVAQMEDGALPMDPRQWRCCWVPLSSPPSSLTQQPPPGKRQIDLLQRDLPPHGVAEPGHSHAQPLGKVQKQPPPYSVGNSRRRSPGPGR